MADMIFEVLLWAMLVAIGGFCWLLLDTILYAMR